MGVPFDSVLKFVKKGSKVRRNKWDKNFFIFLIPGSVFKVNRAPLLGIYPEGTEITYHGHIDIKTEDYVSPWVPTQEDILAEDWILV